jgi:hypothetical protein
MRLLIKPYTAASRIHPKITAGGKELRAKGKEQRAKS